MVQKSVERWRRHSGNFNSREIRYRQRSPHSQRKFK